MFGKGKQALEIHQRTSVQPMNHEMQSTDRFLRVSNYMGIRVDDPIDTGFVNWQAKIASDWIVDAWFEF